MSALFRNPTSPGKNGARISRRILEEEEGNVKNFTV